MNRILVFNSTKGGHFAEWIQHLLNESYKDKENKYYYVIPNDQKQLVTNNDINNVRIEYLIEDEINYCNNHSLIIDAYKKTILLRKYAKKYNVNKIFLLSLMHHLPFCCMMLPSKVEISGIIYRIYLYEWNKISSIKKIIEIFKYLTIKYLNIKKAFILNGNFIAEYINKLYNTNKFSTIVDPFNSIEYTPNNLREKYVNNNSKIFIHIGALTERKGTLTILDAISLLPDNDKDKFTFIFAGKVHIEIKQTFYDKVELAKNHAKIIVFDHFWKDVFFHDLCYTCDGILIPYQNTTQSSGIIGWAAQYKKKVIGPSEGLLGKLIKIYKLGYRINNITPEKLKESFYYDYSRNDTNYIEFNQTHYFLETIFNELKKINI